MFTLESLNSLPLPAFSGAVGDVFEHATWVADAAFGHRPFPTVTALHDAMMGVVRASPAGAAARLHPRPSGTRLQGEAARHHRGFPGRTGLARARPAERCGIQDILRAERGLCREIRHPVHHLRAAAYPRLDPEGVRAAAVERYRHRAQGGARRDRADHAAAPGRQGRRSGQAEDRRAAVDPRPRQCQRQAGAGREGLAL